jgi:hypothetical protein
MATQTSIDPAVLQELQQWKAFRDSFSDDPAKIQAAAQADPNIAAKYNGDTLSDAAKQYAVGRYDPNANGGKGGPANGVNGQHFDVKTGQIEKNKGAMDLPETYAILAAAAGLGGVAAAPFIAGGAGGASGATTGTALGTDAAGVGATSGLATGAGVGTSVAAPSLADISGLVAGGGVGEGVAGGSGTLKKVSDLLGASGSGVGAATNAAANNRLTSGQIDQQANAAYETQMLNRAKEEQSQRNDALKQQYYANYVQNRKPGPFNTAGLTAYGPDVTGSAAALAAQAKAKLANAPTYDTNNLTPLQTPDQFMAKYGQPSTLEKVGNYASPALSTLGKVLRFF